MRDLLRRVWYVIRQRQFERELAEEIEFHRAMAQRDLEQRGMGAADRRRSGAAPARKHDAGARRLARRLDLAVAGKHLAGRRVRDAEPPPAAGLHRGGDRGARHSDWTAHDAGHRDRGRRAEAVARRTGCGSRRRRVSARPGRPWRRVRGGLPLSTYRTVAEHAKSLSGVVATVADEVRVGTGDSARSTQALLVTGNFFEVLGIGVAPGRGFSADEDRPGGAELVAVLAYDYWQSHFGGDPAIIGNSVRVNDVPFTVIGVASRDFSSAEPAYGKQLFLPMAAASQLKPHDPTDRLLRRCRRTTGGRRHARAGSRRTRPTESRVACCPTG